MTGLHPPGAGDGRRPPTVDPGPHCSPRQRMELGSYALGALDRAEADQVRRHLLTCPLCRAEYRELAAVPAVLARISETEMSAGPVPPGDQLLARLLARAAAQEGFPSTAAAAVPAAASASVAAASGRSRGRRRAVEPESSRAFARWWTGSPFQRVSVALAGAALTACTVVGVEMATAAPPTVFAKTLTSTNVTNGVHGVVQYHAVNWGSWVQITMYDVPPGDDCSLIAVDAKGDRSVASTWFAPSSGTATIPGGVAMEASDIVRFDVVTATGTTLLNIPVN